jgi:hypothetical protein
MSPGVDTPGAHAATRPRSGGSTIPVVTGNVVVGGIAGAAVVEDVEGGACDVVDGETGTSMSALWPPEHARSVLARAIATGALSRLIAGLRTAQR